MLEKIGHIKNPLTVIALFAGIAEVSGAAVLPFIERPVQETYVWFLMGFPCLIVLLFYITLWWKHHVLYAPGDYRDESNFTNMFRAGSAQAIAEKSDLEIDQIIIDEQFEAAEVDPVSNPPRTQPEDEVPLNREFVVNTEDTDATVGISDFKESIANENFRRKRYEISGKVYSAENLALKKLSNEMGVELVKNVSPLGMPKIIFDAVAEVDGELVVFEIKLVRFEMDKRSISAILKKVDSFYEALSFKDRIRFRFVFVIVVEDQDVGLVSVGRIANIAATYRFNIKLVKYNLADLESAFGEA
ncbi:hypothetical protein WG219_09965 [Ectopseudomonas mendocina]|uniref:Uncharacterized protein n=1 Tax=Ectopseudomonas mendocina TaxID=300 RepID=A0ABZ2RNS0_ECTME